MSEAPGLRAMLGHGLSALRRHARLTLALYAVQLAVAALAGFIASQVLAAAFSRRPLFDEAVDGDVVALLFLVNDQPGVFSSLLWIVVGAGLGYLALSWFLAGGLYATLLREPATRSEAMAAFGAGGVSTFFAYLRLALLCVAPYAILAGLLVTGGSRALDALLGAVTLAEAASLLLQNLAPAAVLLHVQRTVVDYARIELSRAPGLGAGRALFRAYGVVLTSWRPLAHAGLYIAFFAALSLAYVAIVHGRPMAGAGGALLLVAMRQAVALVRTGASVVCAAGQVLYAGHRARARGPEPALRGTEPALR